MNAIPERNEQQPDREHYRDELNFAEFPLAVKGGVKIDHRDGEKADHFVDVWAWSRGFARRLERRPATPAGRRV